MSASVLERDDLTLEKPCPRWDCINGKDKTTVKDCNMCEGTGKVMTDFGAEVLDFVKRRLVTATYRV